MCDQKQNPSNSEVSRENFEDPSSTQDQDMQDQDIVQEQIQEQMEPENKTNIFVNSTLKTFANID